MSRPHTCRPLPEGLLFVLSSSSADPPATFPHSFRTSVTSLVLLLQSPVPSPNRSGQQSPAQQPHRPFCSELGRLRYPLPPTGSCPEAGWLFLPESVSWGCYNKLPKAGRIKTSEMYSLTVLQAKGGNQGICRATLLQTLLGRILPGLSSFSLASLTCSPIPLISGSAVTLPPPLWSVATLPLCHQENYYLIRAHPGNPG